MVLPAAAAWAETEGTVTNSERRVQRVRKAVEPPERGPRRPLDHLRARQPDGRATGAGRRRRGRLGRGPPPVAGPRRDDLRAARGARRDPVAVLRRDPPGRAVPPQPALGGPAARQPRAVRAGRPRPAGRQARRRLPDPADDRPPARLVQHRRPDRRLHLAAAPRRDPRHLARRTPRPTASPTASASGSSRAAARSRSRSGSTSRSGRA